MEEEFKGRVFEMLDKLQPAAQGTPQGLAAAPVAVTPVIPASAAASPAGQAVSQQDDIGRNDKVTITNGTETKEVKFKKAEPLIQSGEWKIVK